MSDAAVWLDPQAQEALAVEALKHRLVETGGPLIGFFADETSAVLHAHGPGPGARHRPTSFRATKAWKQRCINEAFAASEGRWSFVGEWHTHPGGRAEPSSTDQRAAEQIAKDAGLEVPRPIVLIQSLKIFRRRVALGQLAAFRWSPEDEALRPERLIVAAV